MPPSLLIERNYCCGRPSVSTSEPVLRLLNIWVATSGALLVPSHGRQTIRCHPTQSWTYETAVCSSQSLDITCLYGQ